MRSKLCRAQGCSSCSAQAQRRQPGGSNRQRGGGSGPACRAAPNSRPGWPTAVLANCLLLSTSTCCGPSTSQNARGKWHHSRHYDSAAGAANAGPARPARASKSRPSRSPARHHIRRRSPPTAPRRREQSCRSPRAWTAARSSRERRGVQSAGGHHKGPPWLLAGCCRKLPGRLLHALSCSTPHDAGAGQQAELAGFRGGRGQRSAPKKLLAPRASGGGRCAGERALRFAI